MRLLLLVCDINCRSSGYDLSTYNHMIIFDTEANGLMGPTLLPVEQQPRLLEFGAIKVNAEFEEIDRLEFFVNPGMPIDPVATKITGITDAMVAGSKKFAAHYLPLVRFFLGEEVLVAHNAMYDTGILSSELTRIGKLTQFPWPFRQICTVEQNQDLDQKYLKLSDLYEKATGKKANQTHRAIDDVLLLLDVVRWMNREGRML